MQTFLPYEDFVESAKCLDRLRLGKQRLEAFDIYQINTYVISGYVIECNTEKKVKYLVRRYSNHPIVKMWRGYENMLLKYGLNVCNEWVCRGYNDIMTSRFIKEIERGCSMPFLCPKWLGDERLHSSHRANLLRKDYVFYSKYGWKESVDIPYFWGDYML
jgi:hypothetical protein